MDGYDVEFWTLSYYCRGIVITELCVTCLGSEQPPVGDSHGDGAEHEADDGHEDHAPAVGGLGVPAPRPAPAPARPRGARPPVPVPHHCDVTSQLVS